MNHAVTMTAAFPNRDARNAAPTPRQADVLAFYQRFTRSHGYAPTIREAGEGLSIESTNAVADHLAALMRKGYIARRKNKQRGVIVLKNPDGSALVCCPTCKRPR
jgi:repressor LexA